MTTKKNIDCFLIGQNQITFEEYEKALRKMGVNSGAYRDLEKNTLQVNNKTYSAADVFNSFCVNNKTISPIKNVETFSAGIAYLGTYLHRRGFTFDYANSFQDEKEYIKEILEAGDILTIAILTTFYVTPLPIIEIVRFIKKYNERAKIIVGGPFISTKYRTCGPMELTYLLEALGADFYVNSSQGEAALVNIIGALKNNSPLNKINNIYYKCDREFSSTPIVRENNAISENMVNWDLFSDRVGEFINVRTGISCPFACSFCGFPQHAGEYQTASVDAVEEELNRLSKIKSVKGIHFVDDTFNIPVNRFKELLRMMIRNNYSFKWSSFLRCQFVDREMVELMRDSGCESVLLGVESGNDQILKNMNKAACVDKYFEGITLLKEYGITTLGNFIVGFPGETESTVQDTVDFIEKSELDFYRTQLWYYEPITPIASQKEKYDLQGESFEWSHKTMNSEQACNLIEKIILRLETVVRYPQYYFDYDNIFQLPHKGLTIEQVKKFLKSFDNGVKEKLRPPYRKEAGYKIIKQIKESCLVDDKPFSHPIESIKNTTHSANTVDMGEAEFDF